MAYPGPYSGLSTLAQVARATAFVLGLTYGTVKMAYYRAEAKAHRKAVANAHQ